MFCPQCRGEFLEEVTHCASCQVDLVESIPDEDIFASPESMARALAGQELEAVVVGNHVALRETQDHLAAEARIPSVIAGEAGEVEPGLHTRFFLMVAANEVEAARAYFRQRWEQGLEVEGAMMAKEADPTAVAAELCPACNSAVPDDLEECPECGLFLGKPTAEG